MLEANYTQTGDVQPTKELGAVLIALDKLEGEIKNLHCSIDLLQRKLEPVLYFTSGVEGEVNKIGSSGCFVYEKIEERISELFQMRQRLNSIIEALQV